VRLLVAIVLGVVEGLTEYLPVSSTGHLILAAWMLGLGDDPARWDSAFTFEIVIQAGAIAAVLGLYRRRVASMARGLLGRDDEGRRLATRLLVAFLPALVLGLPLGSLAERHLNGPWPVVAALFVGGVLLLVLGRRVALRHADGARLEDLTVRHALLVGLLQCVAMWPGTSRSMMTIGTALVLGYRPAAAAEFSFLLALPTLGAATAYKAWTDGAEMVGTFGLAPVVAGFAAAFASAAVAVRWLVGFLDRRGVAPFGVYRIAVAIVVAALLLARVLDVPA
jgi:undecaprenyl-diphosphatase